MKMTDLDAYDYLGSLALTEEPSEVMEIDGGALFRIADEHFVILACTDPEHPGHKGAGYLRRVLPPHWGCFYSAANPSEYFEAHHYGPVDE